MRPCRLTPHLGLFDGTEPELLAHVRRCRPCGIALRLLQNRSEGKHADEAHDWPTTAALVAYRHHLLGEKEAREVEAHVASCDFCQAVMDSLDVKEQGPDLDDLLARADRELDVYDLTREIAEWLSEEYHPEERPVVSTAFDEFYAELEDTSGERRAKTTPVDIPLLAAFVGRKQTRVAWMIAVARHAALLCMESASRDVIIDRLERSKTDLVKAGIPALLVDHVGKFIRQSPRFT